MIHCDSIYNIVCLLLWASCTLCSCSGSIVCLYIYGYVRVCVRIYACVWIYMDVCVCIYTYTLHNFQCTLFDMLLLCMCVCVSVCLCVCVCVCVVLVSHVCTLISCAGGLSWPRLVPRGLPMFSNVSEKIGKAWSIWWCNDYISAISNRLSLADFTRVYWKKRRSPGYEARLGHTSFFLCYCQMWDCTLLECCKPCMLLYPQQKVTCSKLITAVAVVLMP